MTGRQRQAAAPVHRQAARDETLERLRIVSKNGGYVTGAIHTIAANVPPENVLAFFETAGNDRN